MPLAKSWTKRSEETHIASVVDSMGWANATRLWVSSSTSKVRSLSSLVHRRHGLRHLHQSRKRPNMWATAGRPTRGRPRSAVISTPSPKPRATAHPCSAGSGFESLMAHNLQPNRLGTHPWPRRGPPAARTSSTIASPSGVQPDEPRRRTPGSENRSSSAWLYLARRLCG